MGSTYIFHFHSYIELIPDKWQNIVQLQNYNIGVCVYLQLTVYEDGARMWPRHQENVILRQILCDEKSEKR